ncbi:MAG: hypothetical protein ACI35S_05450 [Anaeroplasma sp.]
MITVKDLVECAQSSVWFEAYNGEGDLLFEGSSYELEQSLIDEETEFDALDIIDDYWITDEGVLCFHI